MSEIIFKPIGQVRAQFSESDIRAEAKDLAGELEIYAEFEPALEGIDVLLLMVDASRALPHADELLLERAKRFRGKTILALNKVDGLPKQKLLPLIEAFHKAFEYAAIVPISALKGDGCQELLGEILRLLPAGEPYFPEDQVKDKPERFLDAEIGREKAVHMM